MGRLRLARRELGSLRREKTIVLALVVQLFIAAFSSFLVVGLVSMYDPGAIAAGGGLAFGVTGSASGDLAETINADDRWVALRYPDEDGAMRDFSRGRIDAVLRADRQSAGDVRVQAIVPKGSLRSTLVVVQVREALSTYEREQRRTNAHRLDRRPVPPIGETDGSPYFSFTYTVLLPLLMVLPAFISGSIAADSVVEEFEQGTIDLLRAAPLSLSAIVEGKVLAAVALAPTQAGIWLLLLHFNGIRVADPVSILVLVTGVTTLVAVFGATLGVLLSDRRSAQFLYSMGMVALFTGTHLLPESPANAIARLAVGHPGPLTHAIVVGAAIVGIGAVGGLRIFIPRTAV